MSSREVIEIATVLPVTTDGKIVVQKRPPGARINANLLGFFGGHIEPVDVDAYAALTRELDEELRDFNPDEFAKCSYKIGKYLVGHDITGDDNLLFHMFGAHNFDPLTTKDPPHDGVPVLLDPFDLVSHPDAAPVTRHLGRLIINNYDHQHHLGLLTAAN